MRIIQIRRNGPRCPWTPGSASWQGPAGPVGVRPVGAGLCSYGGTGTVSGFVVSARTRPVHRHVGGAVFLYCGVPVLRCTAVLRYCGVSVLRCFGTSGVSVLRFFGAAGDTTIAAWCAA